MDELSEKVNKVNLAEDVEGAEAADKEELPPELMNLIKEAVEDGAAENEEPRKEVTAEELSSFFEQAIKKIREDSLPGMLAEAVKDKEEKQARLDSIKDVLNPLYEAIWKKLGVEYEIGKHAIQQHQSILQDTSISQEVRQKLSLGIRLFSQTEQRLVKRTLMGEEAYEKQLEEEKKVAEVRDELIEKMKGLNVKEQAKLVVDLKEEGAKLREKLKSLGQEEAVKYITDPSPEDQQLLYKLSALTMIMGGGGHGHTHGGQPCTGHGHAQHEHGHEAHGHSHNGQPCGGHGHSHQPAQHQHSHGGKPCSGHH